MSLGALNNSSSAMMAQSHGLDMISTNIANVNSAGYKTVDSQFGTLLSAVYANWDSFTVGYSDRILVDRQGELMQTGYFTDLAIEGSGFFVVNGDIDSSGETLYSRNGGFGWQANDSDGDGIAEAFLVDANGNYVQGWMADASGAVTSSSSAASLTALSYDPETSVDGRATTAVSLSGNLDAAGTTAETMTVPVHDNAYAQRELELIWTPTGENSWEVSIAVDGGSSTSTIAVTFNSEGHLTSPSEAASVAVSWEDGSSSTLAIDLAGMTQYASDTEFSAEQDGYAEGSLTNVAFDSYGRLIGFYDNGTARTLFQVAMADFAAPNRLEARSGNLFALTADAGDPSFYGADSSQASTLIAGALEASTVDMADQFTRMIMTQKAYSSAATVFRTADEMTQLAGGLKR